MAGLTKSLVPVVPGLYTRIMSLFPEQYFRFCFAYGSGVLKQSGVVSSKPMIDMVFVVDDSNGFHGQNIHMNPSHYSGIRHLGHRFITVVQEKLPARVYYNTLVPIPEENVVLKYGVTTTIDLINDLLDWNYLYLAGRLHKPVEILLPPTDPQLISSLKMNLLSALHAAFLILPQIFTERELYTTIAALSYNGDFRMIFGEDKNKVNNIVNPQVEAFRTLYAPYLEAFEDYVEIPKDKDINQACIQDMSTPSRTFHLFQLPKDVQKGLALNWLKLTQIRVHDTDEILNSLAYYPDISSLLITSLRTIVFDSSVKQSLKGILTAGLMKSFTYSNKKIVKMMKSKADSEA